MGKELESCSTCTSLCADLTLLRFLHSAQFDDFRAICKEHGKDFDEDVWPQILEITRNVFRAAGDKLNPRRTDYCFELMGCV